MRQVIFENGCEELTNDLFDSILEGDVRGIIPLAVPVANINEWYETDPAIYELLLGLSNDDLERIIYYADVVITDEGNSSHHIGDIISYGDVEKEVSDGKTISFKSGFPGLRFLLNRLDIDSMLNDARRKEKILMGKYESASEDSGKEELLGIPREVAKTRSLIDAIVYFLKNKDRLEIKQINMIPLEIRGILLEESKGRPYSVHYDLMSLYSKIISRNQRLKRLLEISAPAIIVRNECRRLQECIDALIANGKRKLVTIENNGKNADDRYGLVSLSDIVLRNVKMF